MNKITQIRRGGTKNRIQKPGFRGSLSEATPSIYKPREWVIEILNLLFSSSF